MPTMRQKSIRRRIKDAAGKARMEKIRRIQLKRLADKIASAQAEFDALQAKGDKLETDKQWMEILRGRITGYETLERQVTAAPLATYIRKAL